MTTAARQTAYERRASSPRAARAVVGACRPSPELQSPDSAEGVAGVIGTKKLRYDIWGTDVLTAVKMESNGIPGEVCVSDTMRKYLEGPFQFEKHKNVELTGFNKDGSKKTIDSYKLTTKQQARIDGSK